MTGTPLKSNSRLEQVLASGAFALTAELGPPKSADVDTIRKKAEVLRGMADAVNITDNQTAIVRMSSIAAGVLAAQSGLEPVIQITCRDRNRLSIQADILGAYALGMRNVLCLTGDHQVFGNHRGAKNVYDLDSIQLIQIVKKMRDEKVFANGEEIRNSKKAPVVEPRFFIGAAENPFGDPLSFRVTRLAKKIAAGVDFIQTQCIYDMPRFGAWLQQAVDRGLTEKVAILAGITPLKSVKMAEYMRDEVAGLTVPDELIKRLAGAANAREEGMKIAIEQVQQLRGMKGVRGVHIMAIEAEESVGQIAQAAGLLPRPVVAA